MVTFGRLGTHLCNTMEAVGLTRPWSYATLVAQVAEPSVILKQTADYLHAHADELGIRYVPNAMHQAARFFVDSLAVRIRKSPNLKDQQLWEKLARGIAAIDVSTNGSLDHIHRMFKGLADLLSEAADQPVDFLPVDYPLLIRTMSGPLFDWDSFVDVMRSSRVQLKYVFLRREEDGLHIFGYNDPNVRHAKLLLAVKPADGCEYTLIGAGMLEPVWGENDTLEKLVVTGASSRFPTDGEDLENVMYLLSKAFGSRVELVKKP